MNEAPPTGLARSAAVRKPRLEGGMGAFSLAMTVLAYSAPIAVASGFLSLTIIFGGSGSTLTFLVATVILVIFTVGYIALVKHLPKPGGFYALISTGLGKVVGLGSAFLATSSYLVNLAGVYVFTGVTTVAMVSSFGGGVTEWWIWGAIAWVIVTIIGYLQVDISAKILATIMVFEVVLIIAFNIAVFARGGAEGLSIEPWTPAAMFAGNVPVTLLFCFLVFFGFEATALFRDEVRDPARTIPRATYGAVIFIGVLYTVTQYALYSAFGSDAVEVANADPVTMFSTAIGTYIAPVFTQIVLVLVVTSEIASLIAIHNITTRYAHNLAANHALPAYLGAVHPRFKSPHRASTITSVVALLMLIPFILAGTDGTVLYAVLIGLAAVGILFLMALVNLSSFAWFLKNGKPQSENVWTVYLAPIIATVTLGASAVFAAVNFDLVGGGSPGQFTPLEIILAVAFVLGVVLALYFRSTHPERYRQLGRDDRLDELQREVEVAGEAQPLR